MNTFFTQLQKEAQKIRLSESERSLMRSSLEEAMAYTPVRPPARRTSRKGLFPKVFAVGLSMALVAGGSVAYAAEGALPGQVLYPVKIGFNERLFEGVALSSQAKADWHLEATERRLAEMATLASEGALTEDASETIALNIETHAARTEEIIRAVEDIDRASGAKLAARFDASRAVQRALAVAFAQEGKNEETRTVARSLAERFGSGGVVAVALDARVAKSGMNEEVSLATLQIGAPVLDTSDEEEGQFARVLEGEASTTIATIEVRLGNRAPHMNATTTEDVRTRLSELRARLEEGRQKRARGDAYSAGSVFREVLDAAVVLDTVIRTEDTLKVRILPTIDTYLDSETEISPPRSDAPPNTTISASSDVTSAPASSGGSSDASAPTPAPLPIPSVSIPPLPSVGL